MKARATTGRERRLWTWTAVAAAGAYATLGLSSLLPDRLYNQTVTAVAFLSAMFPIAVAVPALGLRLRGGRDAGPPPVGSSSVRP